MYLKPYHNDRSLSLDSPNQIAHLLSNSPAPATVKQTASKHPSYPPRYVPFKNVTNNDSLRNILSGPNISMASPSPSQTSFNTIRSPSMTALHGPTEGNNTKRKMHGRTKSAYPDKENDYEKSIMIAVRAAHNLQAEKEKDFAQEKITLEGDVLLQTRLMEILLQRVSANREVNEQYRANLEENLEKAQDLLEKTVINSDSVWIDLPLDFTQWNESVKGLSVSNTNLKVNIERLLGSELYNQRNKALDKLKDSEKELMTLVEQVGILVHKMRDAEEKERQMKECKQMAEEDIYSHVVAVTESIFIQEEASDVIDTLSWKDPQAFECIKNEIDLDNKLMELEKDLENQTRELDYKIQNFNRDQLELNNKKERSHNCMESIALLVEKIRALEREMFDPRTNILTRLVQNFKNMNIRPKDCNSILEYLRIFEFGAGCGPTDKMLLIQYQKEVLDEVLFIIRQSQAISSMEAIFLSRGRRSASVLGERKSSLSTFESSGPAKELQNEIVNKKLELNEKLAVLRATKGRKIEKFEHIIRDKSTLTYHMENSFMDALKGLVDSSDKKIVEDIVLDVVGRAEAVWKAYLMIEEELNTRNKENRGIEESLDFLVQEIYRQGEIIESNKRTIAIKQEEVRIILDQLRALEDKYLQNDKKREEGDDGFGKDAKSEVMLERKQVKNRRGDSLTKLTRNFSAMENKISDLRKMKEEVIRAENLTRKLEQYRNTTLEKIESDLKVVLKRYAGQSAEFKMKVDLIQEELTLTLEQEQIVIRNIEEILYSKYNPESPENQDIIASMTLDIIMIRRFLGDLLKELRGRLLDKFTRHFLDGMELTCIELDEVKRIKEKIERDELPYLEQENVKYTEIIEFEFNKCKELLEEKQERLAQLNKEREKYKNFCDISNELLRDKNQIPSKDSARLSVSLSSLQKDTLMHKSKSSSVIPNLVLHSRNLSILDSAKLSTKFDSNSLIPGSRDERDDKLNVDTFGVTKQQQNGRESGYATPKENAELQLESNWLRGMDIPSLDNSTTKTYNTSINYNNISLKSAHSDKITHFGYNSVPNETKMPTTVKTDKIPRCLGVSEEEFKCLITKFEKGFTVYKRFSATNKVEEKVSVTLSMKGKSKPKKDLIGYGKRVLRLNIKDKCIEVLKLGAAGLRTVIEYKYDWEDLKQVMIPQKTLEILREKPNTSNNKATTDAEDEIEEDAFVLKVSVDVVNKGRTDLILWDIPHVLALWNAVHRISLYGNLSFPLKS